MLMGRSGGQARLHYMMGQFRVLTPGDHVLCAVTGQRIPLANLKYWSVARQEAYASAEISTRAQAIA